MASHSIAWLGRSLVVLLTVVAGSACASDSPEPSAVSDASRQGAVTAEPDGDAVVLRNDADFAVRVAVVESEFLRTALAQWCFGFEECGIAIAGHDSARLPLSNVTGYAPGRDELLVHWWRPDQQGSEPGEGAPVQKFAVRLGG